MPDSNSTTIEFEIDRLPKTDPAGPKVDIDDEIYAEPAWRSFS